MTTTPPTAGTKSLLDFQISHGTRHIPVVDSTIFKDGDWVVIKDGNNVVFYEVLLVNNTNNYIKLAYIDNIVGNYGDMIGNNASVCVTNRVQTKSTAHTAHGFQVNPGFTKIQVDNNRIFSNGDHITIYSAQQSLDYEVVGVDVNGITEMEIFYVGPQQQINGYYNIPSDSLVILTTPAANKPLMVVSPGSSKSFGSVNSAISWGYGYNSIGNPSYPYSESASPAEIPLDEKCDYCNATGEGQKWNDEIRMYETVPNGCTRCDGHGRKAKD